jgi:hypothetical protein
MKEQKHLFEMIKSRISDQTRLADIMIDLLGVSADSVYRRIRGETELTFSELKLVCERFNLSMDEFLHLNTKQSVVFQYTPVDILNQKSYIEFLSQRVDRMTGLKTASEKECINTARDIPFFHYYKYPELAFFRLFAWNDILNRSPVSYSDFCNGLEKEKIISLYEKICSAYMLVPSKEIWTEQTIDTILRLLEYYLETEAFENKDTVLHLLSQLTSLINSVNQYADHGYKGNERKIPFSMYICSVDIDNNYMLAKRNDDMFCFVKLYLFNSIVTDHKMICFETQKWIDDLISKSNLISGGTSIKERFHFFRIIKNKIDVLVNKIELS